MRAFLTSDIAVLVRLSGLQAVGLRCVARGMPAEGRECVALCMQAVGLRMRRSGNAGRRPGMRRSGYAGRRPAMRRSGNAGLTSSIATMTTSLGIRHRLTSRFAAAAANCGHACRRVYFASIV